MKKLLLLLFLLPTLVMAQHTCGADEYNQVFIDKNPKHYQQIEYKLQEYIEKRNNNLSSQPYDPVTIPIVVHIVWNDSVENLHDSIIYQQIEVINRDFNLQNTDTTILTDTLKLLPDNFKINFSLVTQDSLGNPHSGIIRVNTHQTAFGYWDNAIKFDSLGGSDPWDTKKYMNIWIGDLSGGLLGYSQFPGGDDRTDGNVVDYAVVGNKKYPWTYGPDYAGGRVLVHEIGHWLNLFHPWWGGGSSWCGDDGVDDTGKQDGPTYPNAGCPDTSFSNCTPSEREAVKIYMDYCGDSCMVMFTKGQVERGRASLDLHRQDMIIPNITVDTPEEVAKTTIKIYPTLTSGDVNVEIGSKIYNSTTFTIKVYDIKGSIVHSETIPLSNQFKVNLNNLTNGLYVMNIMAGAEHLITQKLTISKYNPFGTDLEEEEKKEKEELKKENE